MKTVTIFGCWWGGNLGDTSILYATIKNLPHEYFNNVIVHSPNPDLLRYYLDEFDFVEVKRSITNYWGAKTVQSIRESDIVVIGGGGLIFSKKIYDPFYSHISNIYPIVRIANICGVNVKLHAIGASHLESKVSKIITNSIVEHTNSVTVRDEKSLEILSDLGKNYPKVVTDPAFLLSSDTSNRISDFISRFDQPFITVSLHSDIDKYTTVTRDEIAQNVLKEVGRYAINNGYGILLYNNYRNDDWLRTLVSQIPRQLEVKMLPPNLDLRPNEAVALLEASSQVIASQMHVNIMSIVARTPNVAIEYDEKVQAMMKQVELENQVVTIENVCEQQIIEEKINKSTVADERILQEARDRARKAIKNLI